MAPLPRPALAFALLAGLSASGWAQNDDRGAILARIQALKDAQKAAPAPAPAAAPAATPAAAGPRSDVAKYLLLADAATLASYVPGRGPDDAKKLAADVRVAVDAYKKLVRPSVDTTDDQSHVSVDFYLRTGAAAFNPNKAETGRLRASLRALMDRGPVLQVDAVYEALKATDGNLARAMGSLAELFCEDRAYYVGHVSDMAAADGKNYYRFAGFYIGLHDWGTAELGKVASYANIAFNPAIYAGAEVVQFWGDVFSGRHTNGVDTADTLGARAKYGAKSGELGKGLDAAKGFRA